MRILRHLSLILLMGLLAACANTASTDGSDGTDASMPLADATQSDDAVVLDFGCQSDDQCAIKDIGSCCGHRPACVNSDSPTDPDAVRAACEQNGTSGICGFPAISACQCVNQRCEGVTGPTSATSLLGDK